MITKEFIKTQKENILRKIGHLKDDISKSKKYDDLGSASEDEAKEFEEFEEKNALAKDLEKELSELEAALERIENGTYGVCEKCKNPIEQGRLEAFPQSRFCASHK
jgi:RNA polymerase-binding transcription factor DksA